jgi:membrane-associated phospholipid phosphatase
MYRPILTLLVACVMSSTIDLNAQTLSAEIPERNASPYALNWAIDAPLTAAAIAGSRYGSHLISERTPLSEQQALALTRDRINRLDRAATHHFSADLKDLSDQLGAITRLAPLTLLASGPIRSDAGTIGVMYVQTFFVASAVSSFSKHLMPRYRPFVFNDDLTYDQKISSDPGKSFLSTQALDVWSTFVFSAKVFNDYYPDSRLVPYVWGGAVAAGSAMSYIRYATGTHYPTDIIAAAILGSAIGYGIPMLHRRGSDNLRVSPVVTGGTVSISATYSLP